MGLNYKQITLLYYTFLGSTVLVCLHQPFILPTTSINENMGLLLNDLCEVKIW